MQSLDQLAALMRQDIVVVALSQDRGGKAAVDPSIAGKISKFTCLP